MKRKNILTFLPLLGQDDGSNGGGKWRRRQLWEGSSDNVCLYARQGEMVEEMYRGENLYLSDNEAFL